ncbi:DNA polymerase zeta catalytic subunit [Taenia solium]|eukprot:TsM_000276700 transcript=TsM_000276700 gene=TsM_000276700
MSANILIKLFKLEYYFDKPLEEFELPYSELIGRTYSKLPVIRCFGSSPSGQKICAHIHGVLPYLFIEDRSIASCLDGTELRNNLRTFVRRVEMVLSIYGFRDSDSTFLKIYLTDPADVPLLAESLLSGAVLGFPVQPFEVHIPYLLQFCADYNLQGMNYLEATAFRVRGIKTKKTLPISDPSNPLTFIMSQDGSIGPRTNAHRQTSTDVEVDISACDILNRLELWKDAEGLNGGLDFLWTEERMRREALMKTGIINETSLEMPSVDDLLPLAKLSPSHLESSQYVESTPGQSRGLSQQTLTELCKLAETTEEYDACLPSSFASSISAFLNASSATLHNILGSLPFWSGLSTSPINTALKSSNDVELYVNSEAVTLKKELSCWETHGLNKVKVESHQALMEIKGYNLAQDATFNWLPSAHQSKSEEDLEAALLDSAKASVSTLLYPNEVSGIDGNGMMENAEEQDDDDLFASILDSSVTSEPRDEKVEHNENEDLFPSFIENLVENSTESESTSAIGAPTSLRLPQVDGVDDARDKRVNQRPRKRRLGLHLTHRHLATLATTNSAFSTECTSFSAPHSTSIIDAPKVNLSTPSPPLSPPRLSTPLRKRRSYMTYIFDNDDSRDEEDIDSSIVLRFPPEATQVLEDEEKKEVIKPLPCHLGDTNFAFHSSVYLTLRDPPAPPSYSQVEVEMSLHKMKPPQPNTVSPPLVTKPEIDLSASLSILWSQEQQQKKMESCSGNPRILPPLSSSSSNPIEVLCHTRRQTGSPITIQRTSQAISISSLGGFFVPDPQFDHIVAASLAFASPSVSSTFLLVVVEPQKPSIPPPIPHQRSTLPALVICSNEIDLFNWIVYLLQSFDPDILLGYDVERWSWNYVVQRAARVGRTGFLRDISRLAPELLNCPFCLGCMSKCSSLLPGDRLVVSTVSSSCSCDANVGDPRTRLSFSAWPCEPGRGRSDAPFACPGRLVFSLWHLLKYEVSLHEYSFETVVLHVLKKRIPKFTQGQLSDWMDDVRNATRWQALLYVALRSETNLTLLKHLDLVARTSEFARVFGIEFFHVLSRGSQYRVESLLLRTARRLNFLLPSPSPPQRAHQRAPQAIPLTLEPYSGLHADAPVVVLDFQSLYPSVAIAHNYCFSTAIGRLRVLQPHGAFEFGCLTHSISAETLKVGFQSDHFPFKRQSSDSTIYSQKLANRVTVSPNGVVFVRPEVYRGVLPRLWRGLLSSRLMVKDSLNIYAQHSESLKQLLDARQLGLKLIANVVYGYTAASFSGRMPCVEVGDSIVHKGRECLERAIRLVEGDAACQMPWAGSKVIYGDTDSLFVKLPSSVDKKTAFELGQRIADAVTASNPAPIKLKLEKVYYPCLLESKKRYVGYAYESPSQTEPKFDAKGIETVRRDHAPFVGTLQFSSTLTLADVLPKVEPKVRACVRALARDLSAGKVPLSACLLTRPYHGPEAYRPGVCAPALQVTRRLKSVDPAREPSVGERVAYYLASPTTPNSPLIGCVKAVEEAQHYDIQPPLHLVFYIDHQLLPPLRRIGDLLGWRVDSWLSDIPRCVVRFKEIEKVEDLIQHESPGSRRGRRRWIGQQGASAMLHEFLSVRRCCLACGGDGGVTNGSICCASCLSLDPLISTKALVRHGIELKTVQANLKQSIDLCDACVTVSNSSNRRQPCGIRSTPLPSQACVNIGCPNFQTRRELLIHLRRLQRTITEGFNA